MKTREFTSLLGWLLLSAAVSLSCVPTETGTPGRSRPAPLHPE